MCVNYFLPAFVCTNLAKSKVYRALKMKHDVHKQGNNGMLFKFVSKWELCNGLRPSIAPDCGSNAILIRAFCMLYE